MIAKEKVKIQQKLEKILKDPIGVLLIYLSIVVIIDNLSRLHYKQPFNFTPFIPALGTLTIAYLAKEGYGKIVVNKANEEQLHKVTELLAEMNNEKIIEINYYDTKRKISGEYIINFIEMLEVDITRTGLVYIQSENIERVEELLNRYGRDPLIPKIVSDEIISLLETWKRPHNFTEYNEDKFEKKDLVINLLGFYKQEEGLIFSNMKFYVKRLINSIKKMAKR